jgi:hypothetical protein
VVGGAAGGVGGVEKAGGRGGVKGDYPRRGGTDMRTIIRLAVLGMFVALGGCAAEAQGIRAITQEGKTVILQPDGTWKYADGPQSSSSASSLRAFSKPATASASINGKRVKYTVWFDESKWRAAEKPDNPNAEYELTHSTGDGYAMLIAERIPIPLKNLKVIALERAKKAAKDIRLLGEERRNVNGSDLLALTMEGTLQGTPFVYYGYYYSGDKGTVQFVTFTGRQLFDEYRADFEELLNGFVAD